MLFFFSDFFSFEFYLNLYLVKGDLQICRFLSFLAMQVPLGDEDD